MHEVNHLNNTGRGIITYTREGLNVQLLEPKKSFEEYLGLQIDLRNGDKLQLYTIYRSPNSSNENNDHLLDLLRNISENEPSHLVIVGDFNLPDINWQDMTTPSTGQTISNNIIKTIQDSFWHQHIDTPTRCRGNDTPSLLDLVITNEEHMIQNVVHEPPLGGSDHELLNINFSCYTKDTDDKPPRPNYHRTNYNQMRSELEQVNWDHILENHQNDVQHQWDIFLSLFFEAQNKATPPSSSNRKPRKCHHFPINADITKKIRKKNALWKKYMRDRNDETRQQYTRIRNQLRQETRQAKKRHEEELARTIKTNPKRFWKYANNRLKTKVDIPDLTCEGSSITAKSNTEKAEMLGEYFASVLSTEPATPIPTLQGTIDAPPLTHINFPEDKILKKLQELKQDKSPGPDNILPKALKEVATCITRPLQIIFETSFKENSLPEIWKLGQISAIHKKGSKSLCSNYRPITLSCILCKIMESIIREKIIEHMNTNKLFSKQQYGFIPGRSTMLQLLHVIDQWNDALDKGDAVEVAYLDFQKAFDKVPHKRLLSKVKHYKIEGSTLAWLEKFLTTRQQRVKVKDGTSATYPVTSGIPQGSVLGPILFVIFINDLPNDIKTNVYMFADDTKLFQTIKRTQLPGSALQEDLDKLHEWSVRWLMPFNAQKSKQLIIHPPRSTVHINTRHLGTTEYPLQITTYEKDLGVTIDQHLSFQQHISESINKANKIMGIIRRTIDHLTTDTFVPLYCALVRNHLEYNQSVWSPRLQMDIDRLERVQRRATKQVNGLRHLSYPDRLRLLKLPTLVFRRLRGDMIETYKIIRNIYDQDVSPSLTLSTSSLRGHNFKLFIEGGSRTNLGRHSFRHRIAAEWNRLPNEVVSAPSLNSFKHRLDKHWADHPSKYNFSETQ